ncbi:ribonuclease T2 family protein [Tepidamorphus sp. 3E244]|uniref:ribonuclease T2 family protein n=1 Tax=Tepidamorphus sp. 3E244 TaxID=3385498 RepID=UPI0038FC418D
MSPIKALVSLAVVAGAVFAGFFFQAKTPTDTPETSGNFDFWVLSLSWSPTFCAGQDNPDSVQCNGDKRWGFIVHGLWPQYESGYPSDCQMGPERIDYRFAEEMADLIPSPPLVFHQWRKHGRCTGMTPEAYFAATRNAAERVTIDPSFSPQRTSRQSPDEIEARFTAVNDGMKTEGLAVTCRSGMLQDVRICLDKSLEFRACREVDADACTAREIALPAATDRP